MSKKNIKILQKNLVEAVRKINHSNDEIWYRVFPLPFVIDDYKRKVDKRIINQIEKTEEFALYIHIPFCRNRCDYCSIQGACNINKIGSKGYVDCLKKELGNILKINKKRKILSVFMGGGTPSLINPKDLSNLFSYINDKFSFSENVQFNMEACPSDITEEMARAMVKSKINKVCLGVQTFNQKKLKLCNRHFQKNVDVYNAVKYLREVGIDNISFDLIYGLKPNEPVQEFLNDNLEHIVNLKPIYITFYPLQNYTDFSKTIVNSSSKNLEQIKKIIGGKINIDYHKRQYSSSFKDLSYFFLRRCLLKNVLAIGLGSKGDYWYNGRYIQRVNKNRNDNITGYKNDIKSGSFEYKYFVLSREASLRSYLIYNLNLRRTGVYKSVIEEKFPQSLNLFNQIINKIKEVLDFSDGRYFLKPKYDKILPFKTKNQEVNYFIFSFCYLYSGKDQNILLKKLKLI